MSKEKKKRNALKHGANAQEVMLWGEKYEDYESLLAELDLEFTPSGSTEKYLVQTLLDLRWRRRRLDCHEQITIQKRLDKIREENETSRHIENLRSFASEFNEATSAEKVEALLTPLSSLYSNTIRQRWPLQTGEDPNTWGPKIAKGLLSWIPPRRHEQADEFIAIVDLEIRYGVGSHRAVGRDDRPDDQAPDADQDDEANVRPARAEADNRLC
jgi:hypothetical protein